ncbi:uncharacterized protein LOC113765892 [Coffea eugenioides]|uniref:uncharacterized protein LOC113765892 n=1 Tax=Coffea eugenioides TaxID=49369 RepID=UPI000F60E562|nr:uncharacterized protein LOC113765892 [Coffea eugenioides]
MKVVKPTYLSVVEHMRHAILAKFEEAAVDELKKNGVLVAMKTHKYIIEFKNQLKDAAVKQANWNQDTEQLAQLESEIARTVEGIRATNELLEQQKARKLQINKDKREFWLNIASIGANVLNTAASVASVIMVAGQA